MAKKSEKFENDCIFVGDNVFDGIHLNVINATIHYHATPTLLYALFPVTPLQQHFLFSCSVTVFFLNFLLLLDLFGTFSIHSFSVSGLPVFSPLPCLEIGSLVPFRSSDYLWRQQRRANIQTPTDNSVCCCWSQCRVCYITAKYTHQPFIRDFWKDDTRGCYCHHLKITFRLNGKTPTSFSSVFYFYYHFYYSFLWPCFSVLFITKICFVFMVKGLSINNNI